MTGESIALAFEVPDEQRLTYKIFPNKGAMMTGASIGRQLTLLSKILCWKEAGDPRKMEALISGIFTGEDGSITIDFIVAAEVSAIAPADRGGER